MFKKEEKIQKYMVKTWANTNIKNDEMHPEIVIVKTIKIFGILIYKNVIVIDSDQKI